MFNLIPDDLLQVIRILGVFVGLYTIIFGLLLVTDRSELKKQKQILSLNFYFLSFIFCALRFLSFNENPKTKKAMYKAIAEEAIINNICKFIIRGCKMIANIYKSFFNKLLINLIID